jgi:hypothetical protein
MNDNFGSILVGILIIFIAICVVAVTAESKHLDNFMAQCMQDHKQYECDAMWRAGEDHTTVMPMPIIIR